MYLLFICGIIVGYLLRNTAIPRKIGRLLIPIILVLLFCMGVLIGENRAIMDNLSSLGLKAFFLTLCCLIGSVGIVSLLRRWLPNSSQTSPKNENKPSHS